jgi:hypothetical protein
MAIKGALARRNAALAASRLSTTPPFGPRDGARTRDKDPLVAAPVASAVISEQG